MYWRKAAGMLFAELNVGDDPCAPRPNNRIWKLSAADVIGPAVPATVPDGPTITCWSSVTSGLGKREQAIRDHRAGALRRFLSRLEERDQGSAPGVPALRE